MRLMNVAVSLWKIDPAPLHLDLEPKIDVSPHQRVDGKLLPWIWGSVCGWVWENRKALGSPAPPWPLGTPSAIKGVDAANIFLSMSIAFLSILWYLGYRWLKLYFLIYFVNFFLFSKYLLSAYCLAASLNALNPKMNESGSLTLCAHNLAGRNAHKYNPVWPLK